MEIAIRKEQSGAIYIDKNLRSDIDYTQAPYNFKIIYIDKTYKDCQGSDFNDDLTFSVEKYNARKLKESNLSRIEELLELLKGYDYIGTKIATGRGTREEYATEIEQMNEWAREINELEEQIK